MNTEQNKLGTMPIGRLLVSMSIPMMISFFIQALYNMVDSMFVARISENALTAVSIAFPLQQIITAIGVGTGVAVNALVPRYTGQGQKDKAMRIANVAVVLSFCYTILFMLVGAFGVRAYYTMQTGVTEIVEDGVQYLSVICLVCAGAFFGQNFEKLLVATGNTVHSMISQASGAIFNIIFDPLLIFGIGPFPEMGVAGAAAATVIGQWVAGILGILLNAKKNPDIQVHFKDIFHPNAKIIGHIYAVGIPSIIMSAIGSVMTFGMDLILVNFTTTAVAVFGAYFKLQSFFFMPIFGMNNALVPIIAYNYGARKKARVIKTIKLGIRYAMCFMLVGMLLFETIPNVLLEMFSPSEDMLAIGIPALRKIAIHFPIAAVCIILMSTLQALGKAFYSMLVSIGRQLVVLLPAAYILAKVGGLHAVWWSFPIAEVVSLTLCTLFFLRVKHNIIDPLEHPVASDLQKVAEREAVQC